MTTSDVYPVFRGEMGGPISADASSEFRRFHAYALKVYDIMKVKYPRALQTLVDGNSSWLSIGGLGKLRDERMSPREAARSLARDFAGIDG